MPPPPPRRSAKPSGPPPPPPQPPRGQRLAGIFSVPPPPPVRSAPPPPPVRSAPQQPAPQAVEAPQVVAPPQAVEAPQVVAPPQAAEAPQAVAPPQVVEAAQAVAPPQAVEAPQMAAAQAVEPEPIVEAAQAVEPEPIVEALPVVDAPPPAEAETAAESESAVEPPSVEPRASVESESAPEQAYEQSEPEDEPQAAAALAEKSEPKDQPLQVAEAAAAVVEAEAPVTETEAPVTETEAPVTETEAPVTEAEAPGEAADASTAQPSERAIELPPAAPVEPLIAAIRGEASPAVVARSSRPSLPPPLPTSPSLPPPSPSAVSLLPPRPEPISATLLSRVVAARDRLVDAVPPRWIDIARQYPALWMVGAPVVLALLLITVRLALQPPHHPVVAPPAPVANTAALPEAKDAPPAPADEQSTTPASANLEGKAPETLSVEEVLLLNANRAERKRADVTALTRQLQDKPSLANDASVQAQLLRFAADPDTASSALGAIAHIPAPVGPDLLYETWTSRGVPPASAELARALLLSHDVRAGASPALAVALDLRNADGCEAFAAALAHAKSDGDSRSLLPLAKLNGRHGCGPKKSGDCYDCLRSRPKEVLATIDAVKHRHAPGYPTLGPRP